MRAIVCGANGAMGKLIDGLMPGEIVGRVSIDGENNVPKTFDELGLVEAHHIRKVDAPSGTALMLFNAIKEVRPEAVANCGRAGEGKRTKEEIGIHALRMGNVVGIHEIHIHTGNQSLTLKHESGSRAMLADGAAEAAKFMVGKPAGFYNMESMLG